MDKKKDITLLWNIIPLIMLKLPSPGILLVTNDKIKDNVMTIGWLQFGYIWNTPTIEIFVRPSRLSYQYLNKNNDFTINVMPDEFNDIINFCGNNSGYYCDKFKEKNIHRINSINVSTPSLKDALITLECKKIHNNFIIPENLNDIYLGKFYPKGDYHNIIIGSIINFKININRSFYE